MRRFVTALVLAILLSSFAIMVAYPLKSETKITQMPARITSFSGDNTTESSTVKIHLPGWARVNLTCGDGYGDLYMYNLFTGEVVFEQNLTGSLKATFPVPKEGTYVIAIRGNGSSTCSLVATNFHAPLRVQETYSIIGIVSSLLLTVLLWRWAR